MFSAHDGNRLTKLHLRSLYRRSLKLALDWSVHRYLWRGQALYIRSLFEANKNIRDPRQQRASSPRETTQSYNLIRFHRPYSKRRRICLRNGSIPTHTVHLQHQEVGHTVLPIAVYLANNVFHQDPNLSETFQRQSLIVSSDCP